MSQDLNKNFELRLTEESVKKTVVFPSQQKHWKDKTASKEQKHQAKKQEFHVWVKGVMSHGIEKDDIMKVQDLIKGDPDFSILMKSGKDVSTKIMTYLNIKEV